jgi:XRE family transcriptional regulator, regulator of sulfur utilization
MNYGLTIRHLRKDILKIGQSDFAKQLGLSQTYLSLLEGGKKTPSTQVLELISKQSQYPMSVLLWLSLTEEDVPQSRVEFFKAIKPSCDNLVKAFFEEPILEKSTK